MAMDEYDDVPLTKPGESEDPEVKDEGGEMTDDKLGMALASALGVKAKNGSAVCEMIRKIVDSY